MPFANQLLSRRVFPRAASCALSLVMPVFCGLPDIIIHYGYGLGDDLLCTAVLRELKKRGRGPVWMMSSRPELYAGLSDADRVVPPGDLYRIYAKVWRRTFPKLEYSEYDGVDQSIPPQRHIIAEFCATAGITGTVSLRPYLVLNEIEKAQEAWAKGQIVIQSSGLSAQSPMRNKEWYPDRFQAVVESLRNKFEFVQLGSKNDPLLQHVTDLRGANIRRSASILHHARLYLGGVGFLMHLARAVECPSVIVYGGREAPWQSGYICNANLYSALPCSPCWRWNTCDFDRKCMKLISAGDVVQAVQKLLDLPRNPLQVETFEIRAA